MVSEPRLGCPIDCSLLCEDRTSSFVFNSDRRIFHFRSRIMPCTRRGKGIVGSHHREGSGESSTHGVEVEVSSVRREATPQPPPTNMAFVFKEFLRKQPLETFDGRSKKGEDVEVWLAKLEEYFTYVPLSPMDKAQATLLLLTGPTKLMVGRECQVAWVVKRGD